MGDEPLIPLELLNRWKVLEDLLTEIPELLITGGGPISLTGKGEIFKPGGDIDALAPFNSRSEVNRKIIALGFRPHKTYWTLPGYVRIYSREGVVLEVLFTPWYDDVIKRGRLVPKEWRYAYFNIFPTKEKVDYYLSKDLFDLQLLESLVSSSPFRELIGWNAVKRSIPVDALRKHAKPLPLALLIVLARVILKNPLLGIMWVLRIPFEFRDKLVRLK